MLYELVPALVIAALATLTVTLVLENRAPARRNTRLRSMAGFFPPLLLLTWTAGVLIAPSGADGWALLWLPVSVAALGIALLMATIASPRRPSRREVRRARRRGEPVDHAFYLYAFAMGIVTLAAVVTRDVWI